MCPEGVPAEPLLDPEFQRLWSDVLPRNCLSPVRLATTTTAACQNPVIEFAVTLMRLTFFQGFDYDRTAGVRLGRIDSRLSQPRPSHSLLRTTAALLLVLFVDGGFRIHQF